MKPTWRLGGRVLDSYFFYEVTPIAGIGNAILRTVYIDISDFWGLA